MNAPESLPVATLQHELSIATISVSRTNPRKSFDQAALDELTSSVKQHGILQPILVRPMDPEHSKYELVAGERRYRAAKAAGLQSIPALVRSLSDGEALELQVIENLQRADLHPLEEAEGYEQLIKKHGHAADELAGKVGKSKAYVYARLKLLALGAEARKAFYGDKISASTALLIARIPVPDLQAKAAKEVITGRGWGADKEPMSYREARDHLQRNYMLRLKDAVFDIRDASLLAKVPGCGDCPKRTGNQPELFGDVKDADVCTDPVCFDAKRNAHYKRLRADAEATNRKIISGKEAKTAFPYEHGGPQGYIQSKDSVDYSSKKTAAALAKQVGIEPVLIERPKTGELVEAYPETALKNALRKAGLLKTSAANGHSASDRKARAKEKLEREFRTRVFSSLRGRLGIEVKVTTADGVLAATTLWERADFAQKVTLGKAYGWIDEPAKKSGGNGVRSEHEWKAVQGAPKRIAELDATQLWRLMIELCVIEELTHHSAPQQLLATAVRHGVDTAQIRKDVDAQVKVKAPAKSTKAKAKSPPKAKSPRVAKTAATAPANAHE